MSDEISLPEQQDTEIPYSGEQFDVRRDVVSGAHDQLEIEYLDTANAVVVIAMTPDDRIIVVEEWRQSVKRFDIGLPGGQLEPTDETLEAAAQRELREETGYETDRLVPMQSFDPLNSLLNTTIHFFVATNCQKVGEPNPDEDERIRMQTESLETLRTWVRDGTITDMKTAVALLYYSDFIEDH
ncbi:NUDIX hydrolase [Natrinema sp. DC36]|uniref:NUDIX hydrolase n=1 Tax=Natrinema sp. DC36 TaxID=2878680 RepID=UPI001CEFE2EB|nr:NUDIX hydrolase [Natrinema sp. DC36]